MCAGKVCDPDAELCAGACDDADGAMRRGAPLDLVFQSIAGTESRECGFGVTLALLARREHGAGAETRGGIEAETGARM
jgi:ethanolamine ammonia-lyase large subunit